PERGDIRTWTSGSVRRLPSDNATVASSHRTTRLPTAARFRRDAAPLLGTAPWLISVRSPSLRRWREWRRGRIVQIVDENAVSDHRFWGPVLQGCEKTLVRKVHSLQVGRADRHPPPRREFKSARSRIFQLDARQPAIGDPVTLWRVGSEVAQADLR